MEHAWQAKVVRYGKVTDAQHLETRLDAETVAVNYLLSYFKQDMESVNLLYEEAEEVIDLIHRGKYDEALAKYNQYTCAFDHAITVGYVEVCKGRPAINFALLHEAQNLLKEYGDA